MRFRSWQRVFGFMVIVLAVVYSVAASLAHPAPPHPWFDGLRQGVLVIAHQGGEGLWPSDTLYAFQQADALGVDVLDMDVHLTRDDVLVVLHDQTVDRTTNGSGAVRDMTLAQIQALDAGYDWPYEGQAHPFRGQGITIPSLDEVFSALPAQRFNIEIKQVDPARAVPIACQTIRAHGLSDRVVVSSFLEDALQLFRQACPEVATGAGRNEVISFVVLNTLFLRATYTPPAHTFQVPEYNSGIHVLTQAFVDGAHARGMAVYPWTLNTEEEMRYALSLGVDGINTDYPDQLLKLLGR